MIKLFLCKNSACTDISRNSALVDVALNARLPGNGPSDIVIGNPCNQFTRFVASGFTRTTEELFFHFAPFSYTNLHLHLPLNSIPPRLPT
jgi:hypothetical protein